MRTPSVLCLSAGRTLPRRRQLIYGGHELLECGEIKTNVYRGARLHPNFKTGKVIAVQERRETMSADWRTSELEIVSNPSSFRAAEKHCEQLRLSDRR